mgnify:CR=1 FL=1|jgi:hypothetical protein
MIGTILATQVVGLTLGFVGAALATTSADELKRKKVGKPSQVRVKLYRL